MTKQASMSKCDAYKGWEKQPDVSVGGTFTLPPRYALMSAVYSDAAYAGSKVGMPTEAGESTVAGIDVTSALAALLESAPEQPDGSRSVAIAAGTFDDSSINTGGSGRVLVSFAMKVPPTGPFVVQGALAGPNESSRYFYPAFSTKALAETGTRADGTAHESLRLDFAEGAAVGKTIYLRSNSEAPGATGSEGAAEAPEGKKYSELIGGANCYVSAGLLLLGVVVVGVMVVRTLRSTRRAPFRR